MSWRSEVRDTGVCRGHGGGQAGACVSSTGTPGSIWPWASSQHPTTPYRGLLRAQGPECGPGLCSSPIKAGLLWSGLGEAQTPWPGSGETRGSWQRKSLMGTGASGTSTSLHPRAVAPPRAWEWRVEWRKAATLSSAPSGPSHHRLNREKWAEAQAQTLRSRWQPGLGRDLLSQASSRDHLWRWGEQRVCSPGKVCLRLQRCPGQRPQGPW